jgi:tetrahydromethanopterin S-methyltransferase subunit B
MAVELGSVRLEHLTHVSVSERARIVRHPVPGMRGDIVQALGRPAVEVRLRGIFYGPHAAAELKQLRDAHLAHTPVDFFAEAVGEGYFAQVLITHLEVAQRAGALDQFDFACAVVEYVAVPTPAVADLLAAPSSLLLTEATSFVDDVQRGLDQVQRLSDLFSRLPTFGDPTERLRLMLSDYKSATGDGDAALRALGGMFSERMRRLLPNLAPLLRERDDAARGMGDLARALDSFGGRGPDSPLAPAASALANVGTKLAIDVRGLTAGLPATIAAIRAALPSSLLEDAASFEQACTTALDFVQHSALVQGLPQEGDPHAAAWALVDAGLGQLERRAGALAGSLIGDAAVGRIRGMFDASDAPVQPDQLGQYIATNLIGLPLDLLRVPADYLANTFAPLAPLDSAAAPIYVAHQAIEDALGQVTGALDTFDPANPNDYDQVQAHMDQLGHVVEALLDALDQLYGRLQDFVDRQDWDAIVSSYSSRLAALAITPERLIDRATDVIADVLGDLQAAVADALDSDDLRQRIDALSQAIRDSPVHATLRKVRQALLDFLEQIRAAIERVPAEPFQSAVGQMLEQIRQHLAELSIDQVGARIEDAFLALEAAATGTINEALTNKVRDALNGALATAPEASVTQLIDLLTDALSQIEEAIEALEAVSDEQVDALRPLIVRLEQLSFKPAAEVVIRELDEIRQRLRAMNAHALSRLQKRAIKATLATLSRRLEDKIIEELRSEFSGVQQDLKEPLDAIFADLERLWHDLDTIDDTSLLKPLSRALEELTADLNSLNGHALIQPLAQQADEMVTSLETREPGRLVDPLRPPYDRLVRAVRQLDPDQWSARTGAVSTEVNRLIGKVDITPRLDTLEQRRRDLLERVRTAILGAVDNLNAPAPLDAFLLALRPLIEDLVDALFGTSAGQPHAIDLPSQLRPASLLAPLDMVFGRLAAAISSVPAEGLVEAFTNMHRIFRGGLDALDPHAIVARLRASLDRLAGLGPDALLGLLRQNLPQLQRRFENLAANAPPALRDKVRAILARFDANAALADAGPADSRVRQLIRLHGQVVSALRRRIGQLDLSKVAAAYARVRVQVERALPDFLRGPAPPTEDTIRAGLAALLPSRAPGELERVLGRFLNRILPKLRALGAAFERLFERIREMAGLLNPYVFRDPIARIFDAIRAKERGLDPTGVIVRAIHDLIDGPLQAIDPARIKQRLDTAYQKALAALDSGVKAILNDIARVIDERLRAIRQKLQDLLVQIGKADEELRKSLERLYDRIKKVVLVELLKSLRQMIDNLGVSFNHELDRVRQAFDAMLAAIPV